MQMGQSTLDIIVSKQIFIHKFS